MIDDLVSVLEPVIRGRRPRAGRRRAAVGRAAGHRRPGGRRRPRRADRGQPGGLRRARRARPDPRSVLARGLEPRGRADPAHARRTSSRAVGETVIGEDPPAGARRPAPARRPVARRRGRLRARGRRCRRPHRCRLAYRDIDRARTVFVWGAGDRARTRAVRTKTQTTDGGEEEAGRDPMSKTNFEFLDALGQIARDKGISVETLLDALANALVAAYKRRPGRGRGGRRHHRPRVRGDPRLRPGARRRRQRRPRVGRHARRLRAHRRPDGQAGHPPADPRGRARSQVRGVRRAARATS